MDLVTFQQWTSAAVRAAWFALAAVFVFRRRAPPAPERQRDSGGLVGLALQGLGLAAVWSLRRPSGAPLVPWPFPAIACLDALAIVLAAGSVVLAFSSVRALGRQWALAARLVEGHELVTGGPYRYVRNPIYSALLGMLLSTGLAFSRPLGLALGVLLFWVGSVVRIKAEERLLSGAFGAKWEAWARQTPALVPGIW
jgi:protein-S-isoprenylcysteine O-methyltransferase Ste14